MAKMPAKSAMPNPAPAAADDDTDPTAADSGAESGEDEDENAGASDEDDSEQGDDDKSDVLLTVLDNGDGTYTLIQGDEDDDEDEGQDGAGSDDEADQSESGAGDEGAEGGNGEEADKPEGQHFASLGALLKGIMDLVKDHEASNSGEGTDDDNFNAGFSGGSEASPPRPTMSQKY